METSHPVAEPALDRAWRETAAARRAKLVPGRLRDENRKVLLNLLWSERTISRADIARETGLSRSTVSAIVSQLLDSGLVSERGAGDSSGGRRPVIVGFDDDAYAIVGIDLGATHVGVAVTDLRGRIVSWRDRPHPVRDDPQGTLDLSAELAWAAIGDSGYRKNQVLGVGVAVPSPVDPLHPESLSPLVLPRWQGVSITARLGAAFGVPIFVDNDANVGALAEQWWGAGIGGEDLAYIKIATGVGAGFIVNGELYRGASGVAGEIGHMTIDPNGRVCECGLTGCLATRVGTPALIERAVALGALAGASPPSIDALVVAARGDDERARQVIGEAAESLGVALANLINLLNPAVVVLGGGLTRAGDALLVPLVATIRKRVHFTSWEDTRIVVSTLGERGIALGAATQVLAAALDGDTIFPDLRAEGPG